MNKTLDFKHRLSAYNSENPDSVSLVDTLCMATDRACASIAMIQSNFLNDGNQLNDEIVFNALESVCLEIKDISEIVNHFH